MEIGLFGYLGIALLVLLAVGMVIGIPLFYVVLTRWAFSGGKPTLDDKELEMTARQAAPEAKSQQRKEAIAAPEAPAVSAPGDVPADNGPAASTGKVVRVE